MAFDSGQRRKGVSTRILELLLFLIILVACLKVADLLLGWQLGVKGGTTNRQLRLKEHAPNLSIKAEPGKQYLAATQGLPERAVTFRTDKDGFIVGPAESAGDVDVTFIGGSTTECLYVDEPIRFPYLVSQLLRRSDGSAARTQNAGVSANHSMHNTLVVLGKVLPYRPRAVVVMHNANDLALLANTGSYWVAPASRTLVLQDTPVSVRSVAVAAKDLLIPNTWSILRVYLAERVGPQQADEFAAFRGGTVDRAAIARDFRSSLTALVHTLRAWNVEPVLMTQFNRIDPDDEFIRTQYLKSGVKLDWPNYVASYRQFNDVVREVAKDTGALLIDLDRRIPHSSKVLYDAFHLNDEGSKIVADIVARELATKLKGYTVRAGG